MLQHVEVVAGYLHKDISLRRLNIIQQSVDTSEFSRGS